jgi:hypothetical protein
LYFVKVVGVFVRFRAPLHSDQSPQVLPECAVHVRSETKFAKASAQVHADYMPRCRALACVCQLASLEVLLPGSLLQDVKHISASAGDPHIHQVFGPGRLASSLSFACVLVAVQHTSLCVASIASDSRCIVSLTFFAWPYKVRSWSMALS